MTPINKPWAEPISATPLKKRDFNPKWDKEEWFYKDKKGNIFPYLKEDMQRYVNPLKPCTFFPLLQELDLPFYEEEWLRLLLKVYQNPESRKLENVFGLYLSKMKLHDFRDFGFKDSSKWFDWYPDYQNAEYGVHGTIYRKDLESR